MPLEIIRNDITKVYCDAIVNAANPTLLGGGGVDGAIHKAAGPQLLEECKTLNGCDVGKAKITMGYNLPAKHVIHTVGPVWYGGNNNEPEQLYSCYKSSLELATENNCESIAFPIISAGAYGYPMDKAIRIAMNSISDFLMEHDMLVYLVVYDKSAMTYANKLFADVAQYIDDNYVDEFFEYRNRSVVLSTLPPESAKPPKKKGLFANRRAEENVADECFEMAVPCASVSFEDDLDSVLKDTLDESFAQMLLRKIDESGMKDSQCYKKANIDKRLFSKIRSNPSYKPSKSTVLAFCVALELSLEETREMLMKAGFALSPSNKFDIIVEYFIKTQNYNIFEINEALFAFDQSLLGSNN